MKSKNISTNTGCSSIVDRYIRRKRKRHDGETGGSITSIILGISSKKKIFNRLGGCISFSGTNKVSTHSIVVAFADFLKKIVINFYSSWL